MTIIVSLETFVDMIDSLDYAPDRYQPTDADRCEMAEWRTATETEGHALGEPTPLDFLDDGTDCGRWWDWMPADDALDTPIALACSDCDDSGWIDGQPCDRCNPQLLFDDIESDTIGDRDMLYFRGDRRD